jgi:CheY-like chemotaxis protein
MDTLIGAIQRLTTNDKEAQVLVVDDDESTRSLLRRVLLRQGWSVAEAENGVVAMQTLKRMRPDIILLDLMMPEMDGFEVMKALDSDETLRDIPVIILTAIDLSKEELRNLQEYVEAVFIKGGYDRQQFLTVIRSLIERDRSPQVPADGE